jgi:hypothetical protein
VSKQQEQLLLLQVNVLLLLLLPPHLYRHNAANPSPAACVAHV